MVSDNENEYPEILDTLEVDSIFSEVEKVFQKELGSNAQISLQNYKSSLGGVEPMYTFFELNKKVYTLVKNVEDEDISDFLHDSLDFLLDINYYNQLQNDESLVMYQDLKSYGFSSQAIIYANSLELLNLKLNSNFKPFLESCGQLEQFLINNEPRYDSSDFMMAQEYILEKISTDYLPSKNELKPCGDYKSEVVSPDERSAQIIEDMNKPKIILH